MVDLRNSRWWDRALESGLPDCRLGGTNRDRVQVKRARMIWDKVFCANCGCDGGLVTADWTPHIFYLCNDCWTLGPVEQTAGLVEIPEATVRGGAPADAVRGMS